MIFGKDRELALSIGFVGGRHLSWLGHSADFNQFGSQAIALGEGEEA